MWRPVIFALTLLAVTGPFPVRAAQSESKLEECSKKYKAAKTANTLDGQTWQQFITDCEKAVPPPTSVTMRDIIPGAKCGVSAGHYKTKCAFAEGQECDCLRVVTDCAFPISVTVEVSGRATQTVELNAPGPGKSNHDSVCATADSNQTVGYLHAKAWSGYLEKAKRQTQQAEAEASAQNAAAEKRTNMRSSDDDEVLRRAFVESARASSNTLDVEVLSRDQYVVEVAFYSKERSRAWPGGNQVFALKDSQSHSYRLSCQPGEKICYGAWRSGDPDSYWGAGFGGKGACDTCCMRCGGGPQRITLDAGSPSAGPSSANWRSTIEALTGLAGAVGGIAAATRGHNGGAYQPPPQVQRSTPQAPSIPSQTQSPCRHQIDHYSCSAE